MKDSTSHSISRNIRKYRLLHNMTQEELAGQLQLDAQYYSQLERGERNFTIEKIVRLCRLLHVGIEDIIEIGPDNAPDTDDALERISRLLVNLSPSQLAILEKFITEVLIYTK